LMWVFDEERSQMVQREITYVPGLYKIFDEILVNAADNKQRDPKGMTTIKIDIDPERNMIKIWNNGRGIPVAWHQKESMYVPSLIFGHLLTSSNYDDTEKKVTGGRNGYGAKLCNIFSTKFIVETQSNENQKAFKQVWTDNMTKTDDAKISGAKGDDFTCVTFFPDLAKFKMDKLDKDIVALFTRRAYDVVASSRGVRVILNGVKLPIKSFKDYVELYLKDKVDENDQPLKIVHEVVSDRWEVALTLSEKGFQQVSFVNSVATTKGGRHVDYVTDQIISKLLEVVKKKEKKAGVAIKPFQVKNHVWVFVNALIENPTFDSQTKENMTLQQKSFGSTCTLTDKFINSASKCGIVEAIQIWMRFKQQTQLNQKCSASKRSKLRGIPKLDDANDAGTKNSIHCTLILTEGDSAKTLAIAGLGVVGRDRYGVFPLRGKVLNVREATHKQIMENAEINNVIKIIGLQYKEKYNSPESLQKLRYGRMMIMTDQDQDGSHIKGLLINFIHHNWPDLLKQNFLEEFITPIVKVSKNKQEKSFYSLPEFEEWKSATDNWHTWKIKYYKGLGTSTAKEAKEYFSDMARHRIPFKYTGPEDDNAIVLAFSKKKIEERKEWLTNWMEERKRRSLMNLPEVYLYGKDTKKVTYNEFVNRELVLFSNMDNERSIPSLVDGFKPGQRKVLFTCLKRNLTKELKVAQLAGSVAEHSAYHHGEQSLMATIINLAQNFVGSNNINILMPIGQFGTRLHGGKDAASPRYIFTMLSTLARHLFNVNDEPLLRHLRDDNQKIEPEWYIPIIPMVLVNGAEGIGTGWSTKIPNYDVREIVANLRRMLQGQPPQPMNPSFKNFRGTIEPIDNERYVVNGEVAILDENTIEITELPVRTWTQAYKEGVLEPMLQGTDKTPAFITDYKEYHTDTTVRFVVKMSADNLSKAEQNGLHRTFKLQTTLATSSMVLFDSAACIKRYTSVEQILQEFYDIRLEFYAKRKDYMEGMLAAESLKLNNQARFICEKIDGVISIENKPKKELIQLLVRARYDSDPVKAWKEQQNRLLNDSEKLDKDSDGESEEGAESDDSKGPDFNYILAMQLWSLSRERKEALLKMRDEKAEELRLLRMKTPRDLWKDDLDKFVVELDKVEQQEREDDAVGSSKAHTGSGDGAKGRKVKKFVMAETKPSPAGRRVQPVIDAATRAKFEAVAAKKRKDQERKELGLPDDSESYDIESRPLSERVGGAPDSGVVVKKPRKKKVAGDGDGVKKESAGAKCGSSGRKSASPKKKKGKKRNPWSDSEGSQSDGDGDDSDKSDADASFTDVMRRDVAPRRAAAAKVKYNFDEDEDEDADEVAEAGRVTDKQQNASTADSDNDALSDDDELDPANISDVSDYVTKTKMKKTVNKAPISRKPQSASSSVAVAAKSSNILTSASVTVVPVNTVGSKNSGANVSYSDDSDTNTKPTAVAASKVWPLHNSDSESDNEDSNTKTKAKAKVSSGKRKKTDDDSGSDFDFGRSSKVKKSSGAGGTAATVKPKGQRKTKKFTDSDGDLSDVGFGSKPKGRGRGRGKNDSSDGAVGAKAKGKGRGRGTKKISKSDDSNDDWSDMDIGGKAKSKGKGQSARMDSDVDDLSEGGITVSKKSTAPTQQRAKKDVLDIDMMDMSDLQPRARSGRTTAKTVKYTFDSDDDDDD
jgi:DNA topoisomerase-2